MLGENFSVDPLPYFEVFGFRIYWYGVIIACGFILAVSYALARKKEFGLTEDNIIDMLIFAVPIGIIGARLYYVVFNFDLYRDDLAGIFRIRDGGLAIYGGVIFSVLTAYVFARVKKIPFGALLDDVAIPLLIGQSVGRWGNFINREAYGSVTNVLWRMGITLSDGTVTYVHPTFLYESLWNLLGIIVLHFWSKKQRLFDGHLFLMYLTWYGVGRGIIEGLRSDSLYLFSTGIRVSQLLAVLTAVVSVTLIAVIAADHKNHVSNTESDTSETDIIKEEN
jgi:phosphatidylglycerol:prolipoprotein diacylglycerol transferase